MTINIASTDYLHATIVGKLAERLRTEAPGVRVALRTLDVSLLEAQMIQGDIDLALMTPSASPPTLRAKKLFDERYVLIGRHGRPTLHPGIQFEELARLDFIIVSLSGGGFSTSVDTALLAVGISRKVALSAASFLFVAQVVAKTDFVALVPERLVLDRTDALKLIEFPIPIEGFEVGMVWHERTHDHNGYKWIRETTSQMNLC